MPTTEKPTEPKTSVGDKTTQENKTATTIKDTTKTTAKNTTEAAKER